MKTLKLASMFVTNFQDIQNIIAHFAIDLYPNLNLASIKRQNMRTYFHLYEHFGKYNN